MATRRGSDRQDAIALLKADHEKVGKLLDQLANSSERSVARRGALLEKIGTELRVHAQAEEEIFYPAFRDAAKTKEDRKLFFEAAQEHEVLTHVLEELESMDRATEKFAAQAKVLKDVVEHHVEEEEQDLMPRCKKLLDRDELLDLGDRMKARKEELLARTPSPAAT